jgi:hypothetical protein
MSTYTRPDATFPAIAENGGRTPMSPADVGEGWSTSSQTRPPAATFNAKDYLTSSAIKYLLRLGVAEWSPTEQYQGLGLCIGSNGSVYWNLVACVDVDPVFDAAGVHWEKTAIRRADCAELIGNVTGGVIPETLNLLQGNNTGSAADSGIQHDGATTRFPSNITLLNGSLRLGGRTDPNLWRDGAANINSDGTSLVLNASGLSWMLLNWDQGAAVKFGNGAGVAVGTVDNVGNASFDGTLSGGGISFTRSSTNKPAAAPNAICRIDSNGSSIFNPGASGGMYLCWDSGTGGTHFGSGTSAEVGHVDNAGNAYFNGTLGCGGAATFYGTLAVTGMASFSVVRIGNMWSLGTRTSGGTINADASNMFINANNAAGGVYFNWDNGTSGVTFGNGAASAAAKIDAAGVFSCAMGGNYDNLPITKVGATIGYNLDGYQAVDFVNGVSAYGGFMWYTVLAPTTLTIANNQTHRLMSLDGSNGLALYLGGAITTQLYSNGTAIFGGDLTVGSGATLRMGTRNQGVGWGPGTPPNINSDGAALLINAAGAGGIVYFNWDQGVNGVIFGNGAGVAVASIDGAGFADFKSLRIQSAAPAGTVLMGNGTSFVPTVMGGLNGGGDLASQGQRAFGSSYQNSNRTLFVSVTYTVGNGGASVRAYIGSSSASMLVAGQDRINAGGNANLGGGANYAFQLTFIVPPGWWFQVQESPGNTGAPIIAAWIENFL